MTKEDIIRMAREAGFERLGTYASFGEDWVAFTESLEAFAALVAAAEREECAKLIEDEAWRLKKLAVDTSSSSTNTKAIQASNDATAIRARGNT
jgi:hypothetical protein